MLFVRSLFNNSVLRKMSKEIVCPSRFVRGLAGGCRGGGSGIVSHTLPDGYTIFRLALGRFCHVGSMSAIVLPSIHGAYPSSSQSVLSESTAGEFSNHWTGTKHVEISDTDSGFFCRIHRPVRRNHHRLFFRFPNCVLPFKV